ncbi:MAG: hypothetical protein ACTSSJ_01480 [Candidatus Odinarchaeia archaeon]
MGKVKHGIPCSVDGCSNKAVRAVSSDKVAKANLKIGANKVRNVYLCEEHYKVVKKVLKKERKIEKWRLGLT